MTNRVVAIACLIAGSALLGGCNDPAPAVAKYAPPEVSVVNVKSEPFTVVRELPGRIASVRVAEVRSRASGIIVERLFHQGSDVEAGDILYKIDPRPFEVEVMAQEAAQAKAQAVLDQANKQAHRIATLASQHVTSEAENEKAIAAKRQAEADLAARKAEVARAKLNLDYATIRAPIKGRIGAALVSEGALVTANDTTNLATIRQLDPIYADFTQSAADLIRLRDALDRGDLEEVSKGAAKVRLIIDGRKYPLDGRLLFSEAKVDASTGQVTLRGEFPNPNGELLPGMYVRVMIEQGVDTDAIAIPEQAVQRGNSGSSEVYVVKPDGRIAKQAIRTGDLQDGKWLVSEGLKAGDHVVVEGFQKFVAGDLVSPISTDAKLSADAAAKPAVN
ncbi:MAG: efflux transporter periplasmic adaptor subunit [Afipia sp. 62-7]|nr:efflux RND transporter periplasmic adaptor subunit [Afipia sp.]OJU15241.1 MAG: efflux transporter periplasmic adaptor subunit [Afipia sp. 62-7]